MNQKYENARIVNQSALSFNMCLVPVTTSPKGFQANLVVEPAAGTRLMRKLVERPAKATPSVTAPSFQGSFFQIENRYVPREEPRIIATNVLISSSPLARDNSLSGTISGTIPYFAGLKTVECTAIRNRTVIINGMLVDRNDARPRSITKISKTLTEIRTVRLLISSARWPE